ncbi:MAG: TRAP transporter substrate-binding protein DctP [Pseudomonadota bacterium]
MDKALLDDLEAKGMVAFGFAGAGFAQFMANSPIRTLDDIKGQKVWVPEGDKVSYAAMESLGLSPVTLPMTDVLTGLQTGLIDIIASSPVGAVVFQWHTKIKYVTKTPLVYVMALTVIDKRTFRKMSPEDQQVVRSVMESLYRDFDRQAIEDNESAFNALLANGVQEIAPNSGDEQNWRKQTDAVIDQMAKDGLFGKEALAEIRELITEYRQGQSKVAADAQ